MVQEHRIKFLWDAAKLLRPNKTNNLLKSYYLNITKELAVDEVNLPNERFSSNASCTKCSMNWCDGQYTLKLIPQKIRSTKAKKLIEQYELNAEVLTKKQKCRAKWYKKKISNFLEIVCKLCNHKTNIQLKKPVKDKQVSQKNVKLHSMESNQKKKSKKTKATNKNKSAGLKITSRIKQQLDEKVINLDNNLEAIEEINSSKSVPIKIKNETIKLKLEKILHLKPSGNKTKPNVKKVHQKIKFYHKIKNVHNTTSISKTQQNNKLLQLAKMLKDHSSNQNQSNNNRLEHLLK